MNVRRTRRDPDVDVGVLRGSAALLVVEGEYRHAGDGGRADDEDERQAGESQVVSRAADLLQKKQLEPAAALPAAPSGFIKVV